MSAWEKWRIFRAAWKASKASVDENEDFLRHHFSQLLKHRLKVVDCSDFDAWMLKGWPAREPSLCTWMTYGLSSYVLRQPKRLAPIGIELFLTIDERYDFCDWSKLLRWIGRRQLEVRDFVGINTAIPFDFEQCGLDRGALSFVLTRVGAWVPSTLSGLKRADRTFACVELIPLTAREHDMWLRDPVKFGRLIAEGEIDLLDLSRE